ncbi:MAG: membrane protein insertion efficiency factor YidD [Myxococcota bacterium]
MLSSLFLAAIRIYQRYLSPLKRAPTCRFLPTCSDYAIEAVQRRGVVVGSAKTLWRLLRCNPLCRGGYDPVDKHKPVCASHEGHAGCQQVSD